VYFYPLPKYINENIIGRAVLSLTLLFSFLGLYITMRCWNVCLTALSADKIILNLFWFMKCEWSSDTDGAKKCSDGSLFFYHFDYHKSHTDGDVMVAGSSRRDVRL